MKKKNRLNNKLNNEKENVSKKSKAKKTKNKTQKDEELAKDQKTFKMEKKKHPYLKAIFILLAFILISTIILFFVSYFKWKKLALIVLNNDASIVYDTDNNIIARIGDERKQENISFKEIPENLIDAYVSIEDERYYTHFGIDIKRTASAILNHITKAKSSFGGSTITQQLVKNVSGNDSNTISRKLTEWIRAVQTEQFLSKEEILEEYLNILYTGPNSYGVVAGSKYYFDKSVDKLTLEECAFLAGINHMPNNYNPFTDSDNTEKINKRTKTVLNKMLELSYITEEEYIDAINNINKGLKFKKGKLETASNGIYSYHTDALISEILSDIKEKYNIPDEFAENILYLGNLSIYSTENASIQSALENEFSKKKYILPATNENNKSSQAAMVIMDHKTGYVLGTVGSLGTKDTARGFNRATQAYRQTGSANKPIAVLAPALSEGLITASSVFEDVETTFDDDTEEGFTPTNYNSYRGNITVRQAIESSQNIPFVKIMEILTPKKSIEYLKEFGITTLTESDENLSLALGGLSTGISPLEMAAAYSTIANDGKYIEPTFYTKATTVSGDSFVKTKQTKKRVLSKDIAFLVKDILTEPVKGKNGTATYCNINGISVAAKTGTTNNNYDKWLCGFTPYYTAACWYGYDYNETIKYNNKNPAGILWANVMIKIHKGLEPKEFKKPYGIKELTICSQTGYLATTGCANTYTEYFLKSNIPTICPAHSGVLLDDVHSKSTKNTVVNYTIDSQKVFNVIDDIKSTFDDITETYDATTNKVEETTDTIIDIIDSNINSSDTNQTTTNNVVTSTTTNTTNTTSVPEQDSTEIVNNTNSEIKNEVVTPSEPVIPEESIVPQEPTTPSTPPDEIISNTV